MQLQTKLQSYFIKKLMIFVMILIDTNFSKKNTK